MTATITKPGFPLRAGLTEYPVPQAAPFHAFWFTGDAVETSFELPAGWVPLAVDAGTALSRPGASEDYTVSYDGFVRTVVFSVAPAAVDIRIIAYREA